MANTPPPSTTETPETTTSQKRPALGAASSVPLKKVAPRSGEQAAADYLQDQNRITYYSHQPIGKRRYITVKTEEIANALITLYATLFRMLSSHLNRALEKQATAAKETDVAIYAARVYVSTWFHDTYRTIRDSVYKLDPLAFNERYSQQMPICSEVYDAYLSYLNQSLKPTQITFNTAEEMYIPCFTNGSPDFTAASPFGFSKYLFDYNSFSTIVYTLDSKKLFSMVPLKSDPTGRPCWLFDWHVKNKKSEAYSWFPMENNFNFVDVTAAFILGVSCSPKLGSCDRDAWVHFNPSDVTIAQIQDSGLERITSRTWRGNAEFRTVQIESGVLVPNIHEPDAVKFKATNKGPYTIRNSLTAEAETSDPVDTDVTVPSSPRMTTRSSAKTTMDKGVIRARVLDFCYNAQLIFSIDDTSRVAALKKFISL